jgi:hypothetical protein
MGWFVGPFGAQDDARWHLGELPSFNAWMVLLPESDRAVIVLTNAGSQLPLAGANEVMSRIPIGVVNLLDGQSPPTGSSLTRFYLVFNAIVAAIVALQLLALWRLARRPTPSLRVRALLPLVWEFALPALILLGVPGATGMSWRAAFMSMPDLTLVLLVIAGLWLITGLLRAGRIADDLAGRRSATRRPRQIIPGAATVEGLRRS